MKKILFIYGYGGSPESKFCTLIRESLPAQEYKMLCPVYPQKDCAKAHEFLLKFIEENDIDLIVGTSLGGFIALTLDTRISTIVLNPCMVPSVELPLLKPRPDHPDDKMPSAEMIDTYKPFEPDAFNKESIKRRFVMGLFAENDELLGTKYKERFIDCYDRALAMPGGHHGNKEAIPAIVKVIKSSVDRQPDDRDWLNIMFDMRDVVNAEYPEIALDDFCIKYKSTNWYWLWKAMKNSLHGDVVIRLIKGGNRIMKVGDSKCGYTPGLVIDAPIVLRYPNGSYQGGFIRSIDYENETFKTDQSTYSFHFVRE